jgi:head-tail adaptor
MVTIGELDRRIRIQVRSAQIDDWGGYTYSWEDSVLVWAKKFTKSGKFTNESNENVATQNVFWTIRDPEITGFGAANYRIMYNNLIYEIDSIEPIEMRDRYYEIQTTQKDNTSGN